VPTRILLVADDDAATQGLQEALKTLGYDVQGTATSAEEAVARAGHEQPDVVFVDARRQGRTDEVEAAKRLLRYPGAPVVYLMGDPKAAETTESRHARAYGYVHKPFSEHALRSAVEVALHRHALERSLRETVDLFSHVFDESPIGASISTMDERYLRVNGEMCELLGYSRDELLALTWRELTHPDDIAIDAALEEQLVRGDIPRYRLEKRYIRKDGAPVEVELSKSLLRDCDGSPAYFIAQVQDVSDRRRAEAAAREIAASRAAEARAQELFVQATDAIFISQGNTLVDVNQAACAMLGYSRDELLQLSLTDLFVPEQVAWVAGEVDRLRRLPADAPRTFRDELLFRRRDGTRLPVDISGCVLHDGRIQSFARDISDRKQIECEREGAFHRLQTVIEQCPIGIIVYLRRPDCETVLVNRYAQSLIGRAIDLERGCDQFSGVFLAPDGTPVEFRELPGRTPATGVFGVEMLLLRRDGQRLPIALNAVSLTNSDQIEGVAVVLTDLSRNKEIERLRAEWNSMITHDLRQPLNVINAQAQQIARGNPELATPARRITDTVNRLGRMVQDLFDLSRVEARQMILARRRVDLVQLLREITDRFAKTTDQPLDLCAPRSLGEVDVDPDRIAQVVENLLSNAVKYGAAGAPIRVEAGATLDALEVMVINRGPGIPPDVLPRLFERFYRSHDSSPSGLGLGLYIARELVEAHGGRVSVASEPGGRTTFRFTLPRAQNVDS